MSRRLLLLALTTVLIPAAALAGPSLTLYTSDLGLVKESRTLDFRGTRDTLRLEGVSNRLDASSLRFVPSSGKLARLAYRYDVATGDGLLERAIGSRVRVVSRNNERVTEGTLLSTDGSWLVVRGDDGALSSLYREAMQEIRLAKPDAGFSLKPAIEAVVDGTKRGSGSAELQYLTGGLSWSAEHTLVRTGETTAQWSAVVRVENTTGRDYRDASVKLIAGEVSRAGAPMPMAEAPRAMKASAFMATDGAAPSEQAFSDFHLYTLPGVVTLRDRESQTLVLLEPKTVAVKPLYVYRGGNASGVQWKLEMVNSAKDGTGAPIPAGRVRCYARMRQGPAADRRDHGEAHGRGREGDARDGLRVRPGRRAQAGERAPRERPRARVLGGDQAPQPQGGRRHDPGRGAGERRDRRDQVVAPGEARRGEPAQVGGPRGRGQGSGAHVHRAAALVALSRTSSPASPPS
jgi:hypothetical protein